jgi:hypothetical protein
MKRFALIRALAAPLLLSAAACGTAQSLTEAGVLRYASTPYDKAALQNTRVSLGKLNGVEVVADHPCSDVCPTYTVRVIHFDVPPGTSCASAGGVEQALLVPVSIAMIEQVFCFPRVLVEHWDEYVR